jgi:hypothetical protein
MEILLLIAYSTQRLRSHLPWPAALKQMNKIPGNKVSIFVVLMKEVYWEAIPITA